MSNTNNLLYTATVSYYEAKKAEALAMLQIYFNNSVGISEHSDHLQECLKWVEELSKAEDYLATLQRLLPKENE